MHAFDPALLTRPGPPPPAGQARDSGKYSSNTTSARAGADQPNLPQHRKIDPHVYTVIGQPGLHVLGRCRWVTRANWFGAPALHVFRNHWVVATMGQYKSVDIGTWLVDIPSTS